MSKQFLWVEGDKFEIVDKWTSHPLEKKVSKNFFVSKKSNQLEYMVIFNKKGPNKDFWEVEDYEKIECGDFKFKREAFFLKEDLIDFIINACDLLNLYLNEGLDDFIELISDDPILKKGVSSGNTTLQEILTKCDDFDTIFENYSDKLVLLNSLDDYLDFTTEYRCRRNGSEFVVGWADDPYRWVTDLSIPRLTTLQIFKLRNNNGVKYYFKLLLDDNRLYPKKVKHELKEFKLDSQILEQICASLNSNQNIIFIGIPGTGKTHLATIIAKKVKCNEGFILTTATSDWTTFDTIGGLMPNEEGILEFHEGKFLEAIRKNKWLIIDEINRADIDKAFGQLFTVLSGQDVELPYKKNGKPIKIVMNKNLGFSYYADGVYYIGNNWNIIATMNNYDKDTLFELSYAFMRRFMFIDIGAPELFELDKFNKNLDEKYIVKLESLYKIFQLDEINRQLGPAIFIDMVKYIGARSRLENINDYDSEILAESINAFLVPQLEGINVDYKIITNFLIEYTIFDKEDQGFKDVEKKLKELLNINTL